MIATFVQCDLGPPRLTLQTRLTESKDAFKLGKVMLDQCGNMFHDRDHSQQTEWRQGLSYAQTR